MIYFIKFSTFQSSPISCSLSLCIRFSDQEKSLVDICLLHVQRLLFGVQEIDICMMCFPVYFILWWISNRLLLIWVGWVFLQSLISTQSRLVIMSSESDQQADSVLCSDAICIEVPTDDIRVGDSVLVLPGETIPVDVSCREYLWSSLI